MNHNPTLVKVTYIISNIDKALAFEWVAQYLDPKKFQLSFIVLNSKPGFLEHWLQQRNIKVYSIVYRSKVDMVKSLWKIYQYLKKQKPQVVHCHLFEANLLGLLAAKLAFVKKRIYTRHSSTFHHQYFPRTVFIDRLINWLATDIIAISNNVKNVLTQREGVKTSKITLIHHGFDFEKFFDIDASVLNKLQVKYNSHEKKPVVGVIARFIEWKGIQYIIPAFKKLLDIYPEALLILANASGNYAEVLQSHLQTLPEGSYRLITFEPEVYALYRLFNIYVHVPIDPEIEAFGQTYVEALAAGIPSIFTLSGVAPEFIEPTVNALVVPFRDSNKIFEAMVKLLQNSSLANNLVKNGRLSVVKNFTLHEMIGKLENLYEK